ncbi:glutathione S-transferase N-terminal domain-containing protein [Zavarzinia sp. CC-PAN008]|uniref:glutathione S-transferase N-terminal domain-containing protein n=1 Tax=Zavarzinia sp. CC-PAN008 TaxID=3243332 RepID=UPI003F749461
MKLYHSPTSPYVRKVRVVALETGLDRQIELIPSDPWAPGSEVQQHNPLGKVPALVTGTATGTLFESRLIAAWLIAQAGRTDLLPPGEARFRILRLEALADGMTDSALARRLEAGRPEGEKSQGFIARQGEKVVHALDALEARADELQAITLGSLATACALGYLDFRFAHEPWRDTHPRLADWYAGIAERPSLKATAPA